MPRLSIITLVALAFAPLAAFCAPQDQSVISSPPVHTSESWDWTDCGLPSDSIQIKSIDVSPDPPQPGQNMTVKVVGIAQDTIKEGAYADVTVKLGVVKLLQKRFDLCEEARAADTDVQCPVQQGEHEVEQTVALPKEIPKAKFTVNVRGYTFEEEDMVCLDLHVNFMKKPFPKLW